MKTATSAGHTTAAYLLSCWTFAMGISTKSYDRHSRDHDSNDSSELFIVRTKKFTPKQCSPSNLMPTYGSMRPPLLNHSRRKKFMAPSREMRRIRLGSDVETKLV